MNYTVNAVAQPALTANADFVVDRRIDMTLTPVPVALRQRHAGHGGEPDPVHPDQHQQRGAGLHPAAANRPTARLIRSAGRPPTGSTRRTPSFVDDNDSSAYESGTDTSTPIDNLAPDTARRVFVVSTIPGGQASGTVAVVTLTATRARPSSVAPLCPQSAGADVAATVQTVFADGAGDTDAARDAAFSDSGGFLVQGATVTVTKTETLISDPINLAVNPKHIPGAHRGVHGDGHQRGGLGSSGHRGDADGRVARQRDVLAEHLRVPVRASRSAVLRRPTPTAMPTAARFTGGTVTVTIPSLAAGASTVITFRVTVN